jgi:hypothetical protein
MDSNHDKVIQSHLCYRYTTRQKGGEFGTSEQDKVNCYVPSQGLCHGCISNSARTDRNTVVAGCVRECIMAGEERRDTHDIWPELGL